MKLNPESTDGGRGPAPDKVAETDQLANNSVVPADLSVLESFRRLKADEVVSPGDFVKNGHQGFDPWEGPSGFRASSFVKPIYRRQKAA